MICKVDWVSFTARLDSRIERGSSAMTEYIMQLVASALPEPVALAMFDVQFVPAPSRAPYSVCHRKYDNSISVYYGGNQEHVLVEVSGTGCEYLSRLGVLDDLLSTVSPILTRLDIAVDMPVATTPAEFVNAGYSHRIRSRSHMVSPTGETCYLGSRDSERYCRVYRYNPPHPRSEWLRVEFVLRHQNASLAVAAIQDVGIASYVAQLGNSYGWRHAAWQPDMATDAVASTWLPERRHGATVRWLLTSVFPAMRRLADDGTIPDLPTFLDTHLFRIPADGDTP